MVAAYLVPLATVHMALLREQYLFGETLYGNWSCNPSIVTLGYTFTPSSPSAPRLSYWTTDYVNMFTYYTSLVNLLVPQWQSWRASLVQATSSSSSFTVTDSLTGTVVSATTSNSPAQYAAGTKMAMLNEANQFLRMYVVVIVHARVRQCLSLALAQHA